MIVRQYAPCSLGRSIIRLGKQGEINALRVEFDVSAWMAMYPDATVKLMHFAPDRPQDNPVIPTLGVEGTLRVWIVGEEDTAGAGNGVIELLLIDERTGSTIKSATGYTTVLRSPSAGIEAQEPEPGYVRYDVDQSALLTDTQKAFARTNIDAIKDEKDPTVPDWAKQPRKPTYTASEVGARPDTWTPSASEVGARPDTWTPSASEVGADAAGTASGAVAAHNTSGAAHTDLRALIEGLTSRLNALADSDDTTLDQLSEIVAYIKSNKALIDAVTTGKVSTSDIVDNLTTNASGKVLSAAQGVALKAMIDGIVIPTALPNPQPITINGQSYDGSEAATVTTVEIDDTLTQSGKAADAKAVGDKLSALNEANAKLKSDITKVAFKNMWGNLHIASEDILQKVIAETDGAVLNENAYKITGYIKINPNINYSVGSGYRNCIFYNSSLEFLSGILLSGSGNKKITPPENSCYCRLSAYVNATEEQTIIYKGDALLPDTRNIISLKNPYERINTINIFNKDSVYLNKGLAEDGSVINSNGYAISPFIRVIENEKFWVRYAQGIVFYDNDFQFLSFKSYVEFPVAPQDGYMIIITKNSDVKWQQVNLNLKRGYTEYGVSDIDYCKSKYTKPIGLSLGEPIKCIGNGTGDNDFDRGFMESCSVFWDSNKLMYGMTYTGYTTWQDENSVGNIGLAWSKDLINWKKDNEPIMRPSEIEGTPDFASVTASYVFIKDGIYYLFYLGCSEKGYEKGIKSLCLATGTDLHNLTRYENNPIISPSGTDGSWYKTALWHPYIMEFGGIYYLFINGTGSGEEIGYGMSRDLINWTMFEKVLSRKSGTGVGMLAGDPIIYDAGDENFYMCLYGADDNWSNPSSYIAHTKKITFPYGWKYFGTPDSITPDTNIATQRQKPYILYRGEKLYCFHTCKWLEDGRMCIAVSIEE